MAFLNRATKSAKPMEPYLGDTGNVVPFRAVQRKPSPDYHWAKRGAVVILGVLVVWYGLILWAMA